jgi:hypothetical protein
LPAPRFAHFIAEITEIAAIKDFKPCPELPLGIYPKIAAVSLSLE